jgi:hypothetical protein
MKKSWLTTKGLRDGIMELGRKKVGKIVNFFLSF